MEKQIRNLLSIIKFTPPLIILIVSILIINILNTQQQKELQEEHKIIEKQFIEDEKIRIKANVSTVYNLIKDEHVNIDIELKKKLKDDVENVYRIMNTIYKRNINKKTNNEIIEEIKIVLRDLRFNNGRTYVGLTNSKAVSVLHPFKPRSEGISVYDLKDRQGKYIIREIISLAQSEKSEGYAEYYFSKPSDRNNEYRKISFIKAFKKLDLIIVVGDYIEDYKLDIENKMLKQFPKLQFKEGGHIYIITFDGDIIYHPSDKAMNTNIFKEDKYKHMDYLFKDLISKEEKDSGIFINIKPKVVYGIGTKDTKVNYVKRFDDWEWMIGLNFNISDANPIIEKRKDILEEKYKNYKSDILFFGIIFTVLMLILSYFMSKLLEGNFLKYKGNLEKQIIENENKNKKLKSQSTLLEQKKTELETIIQESPSPMMIHNEDGKVLMVNKTWKLLTGYSHKDIDTIEKWTYLAYGEKMSVMKEYIDKLHNLEQRVDEGQYDINTKDGKILTWQFGTAPLGLIDGKRAVISSAMDITELKQKERLLFEQTKLASMGEMIGNIAHQWRQPLSIISTAATGMKIQKEYGHLSDDIFSKTCDTINNNSQYLSRTIDDFKNFVKGERLQKIFNLKDTVISFLHLVEGTIKTDDIEIIQDIDQDIKIEGYENELIQCFINIFNNAKDALSENDIVKDKKLIFISTSIQKNKVIIRIKDNANGIPSEVLPRIFEPYFTTKHKSQGTGIGLHMTYNLIVEGMKGTIEARNINFIYEEIDYTGAEFTITLPIK